MHSLIFLALLLQAPNEPKPATIEGTVAHAGSKAAIRKAKVTLTSVSVESTSAETTDDGKFIFKDVKPGRYRLSAEKTGYETTAFGVRRPGEGQGQVLRVDPGAAYTRIDIALPKHGVVTGKILDVENEPVPRVLVMALANMYYQAGRRGRIPRGAVPVISNDLGEYRIGQLPPGKYIVCAIPAAFYQPSPELKEVKPATEEAVVTTCFPNVPQMGEASQLEIKDSTEVTGIDIRLLKTRTVTVQGRITGVPAGAGTVTILNLNTKNSGPMGNAIHPRAFVQSADGKFDFKNVPPGSYILHTLPTGLGNAPFVVKANIEIGEQPVADLLVPAVTPFEIKAKIDAEPGPELKMGSIRVILTPADGITSALAMGVANADGELTLANIVPGRQRITFTGLPATHYVREIKIGDQAADGDEVEVVNAAKPLTIAFSLGRAEITGLARDEKGEPVSGAHVGLIPEPRRAFRLRTARTDQSGVFKLGSLAPGEYHLVALDTLENGVLDDEEFIRPLLPKMKKVKVEESGSQTINLSVLPGAAER